jgi:hypothetical protein
MGREQNGMGIKKIEENGNGIEWNRNRMGQNTV